MSHLRLVTSTFTTASHQPLGTTGPHATHQEGMTNLTPAWDTAIRTFSDYLRAAGHQPGTIHRRNYWVTRAARDLGGSPWTTDPNTIVSWAAGHNWASETRRSVRSSLRTFWAWGMDAGFTTVNAARLLPAIKSRKALPKPTPDHVVAAALAGASERDALMLRLAMHGGLRRAEIARLQWDDIQDGWVLFKGKGGHERRIPLLPELAQQLAQEYARRQAGRLGGGWRFAVDPSSPYVFPGMSGGHINVETVGAILKRALVDWSGHTLRHRFATRALRGSRDIRAVQELLGHASILTTQRYTAVEDEDLIQAAGWAA